MEWTISFLPEQKIAVVETRGIADDEGSLGMSKDISKTMREHGLLHCLIDHSGIRAVSGNVTKIFYRPRELHNAGVPPNIKMAEVVLPEHEELFNFLETVFRNQGFNFRVFKDRETALAWLIE